MTRVLMISKLPIPPSEVDAAGKNKTGRHFLFRFATGSLKTLAAFVLGQVPFHAADDLPIASPTTGAMATVVTVGVIHMILTNSVEGL